MPVKKIRLEPTASLVMRMAEPLYRRGKIKRYFSRLDLSSGEALLEQCSQICAWYAQVILNRKHYISGNVRDYIRRNKKPVQIIIPAAGKTPLGMELVLNKRLRIASVFETDITGMREKKRLAAELFPEISGRIHFFKADISKYGWEKIIFRHRAYKPERPSLIILEGISYYLPPASLLKTIACFKTQNRSNAVMFEYKIPDENVSSERRAIPRAVFGAIRKDCKTALTAYTRKQLTGMLESVGAEILSAADMARMEKLRTGKNRFFKRSADGWIECIFFKI